MKYFFLIILSLCTISVHSQVVKNDTIPSGDAQILDQIKSANKPGLSPKYSPIKAGLYSAVLPGLGQFYNKKYWKIPLVWGAIGTGVGFIFYYQKEYTRYRNDFVAELNGQPHEFSNISGIDATVLGNAQDSAKRYRDYAIALTSLMYILSIVDAVVDAHLYEGRHDPDLSFSPAIINDNRGFAKAGLSINYKF